MSRHLRNSSCSSAVQRPVALGMDLASRARAPPAALDGAFGPATVLDVNVAKSFFSAAALFIVLGVGGGGCSGRAGVKAAGFAGVAAIIELNLGGERVLPLKGVNRCGESAAGLRAMQDINTASLYVQVALCDATNTRAKIPAGTVNDLLSLYFQFVFQGSHSDKIHRPGAGDA